MTGRVVAAIRAGRFPAHLATGFGSLWATGLDGIRVHRISPRTECVVARIEVGHPIRSLVAGAGALWAAGMDRRRKGIITRIDPANGRATGRFHVGRSGPPVVATGFGALWIAVLGPPGRQDHHRLARVDGSSPTITARLALPGYVSDLAAGPGAMWAPCPTGRAPGEDRDPRDARHDDRPVAISPTAAWIAGADAGGVGLTRVGRRSGKASHRVL